MKPDHPPIIFEELPLAQKLGLLACVLIWIPVFYGIWWWYTAESARTFEKPEYALTVTLLEQSASSTRILVESKTAQGDFRRVEEVDPPTAATPSFALLPQGWHNIGNRLQVTIPCIPTHSTRRLRIERGSEAQTVTGNRWKTDYPALSLTFDLVLTYAPASTTLVDIGFENFVFLKNGQPASYTMHLK